MAALEPVFLDLDVVLTQWHTLESLASVRTRHNHLPSLPKTQVLGHASFMPDLFLLGFSHPVSAPKNILFHFQPCFCLFDLLTAFVCLSWTPNTKDFGCHSLWCYLTDLLGQPTRNQIKLEGQLSWEVVKEVALPRLSLNWEVSWVISYTVNNLEH